MYQDFCATIQGAVDGMRPYPQDAYESAHAIEIMNKLTNSSDIPVDHDGPRIWSRCPEMQEWRYRYHEAGS
ncbi:hypothetical protein [Halothiobacillus sp.]|uniref:hypothetical protein n=1 Tax=Halothiobacillus sp. TaxID=1891311 RepID=UPI00260FD2EF|nr:hypothetical protein [Halothiobacillus sp.]